MPAKSTPTTGNQAGRQNNQPDHDSLNSAVLTVLEHCSGILPLESEWFPETAENQENESRSFTANAKHVKQIKSNNESRRPQPKVLYEYFEVKQAKGAGVKMTEKRISLKKCNCFSRYGKYTPFLDSNPGICLLKFPQYFQNE